MSMSTGLLTSHVTDVVKQNGAALVGYAPISRFENAPELYHPHRIFPQTKTVIAFAIPQIRGTIKAVEEGTYFNSYISDSYYFINEVLAPLMLRQVCMLLEDHGFTSVPIHNPFFAHMGRKIREEEPTGPDGMISLRVMGVAAGLGEFGMHKLLMTPEYGPRQRVYAILTDADLEATPLFRGSVCDECKLCVTECQANAIGNKRDQIIKIEDVEFRHAPFNGNSCNMVHGGSNPEFNPFFTEEDTEGQPTKHRTRVYTRYRHYSACVGRGCIRSCMDHLEKTGKISRSNFVTPLIQRKRWDASESWPLADKPPEKV